MKTIIALGANLKFGVVAEGVETEEQAALLTGLGCETHQGFLYSRPEPIFTWLAAIKHGSQSAQNAQNVANP